MTSADRLFNQAADRLKETVRQGLTFDAAQVKVIGLEHIRSAAGASWPHMADRIRANSMAFIESCLDRGDIVIPCGDGFLVVYAHKPDAPHDLARECALIQDALDAFYLGEDGMQMLRAQVEAQRVRATDMAALFKPEGPAPTSARKPIPPKGIAFAPVWSVERQAVGIYMATPVVTVGGVDMLGYDPAYRETGRRSHDDFAALDFQMLDRVAAVADEKGEHAGIVSYCVHATTMLRRTTRSAFLSRLMAIPEQRRRLLVGRIAEIEPGTPVVTIADWVHQLRAYTQRVAIELHPSERALLGFETVGAWSIGCVLPHAMQTAALRGSMEAAITRWSAQAHRQNLRFGLFNLSDPCLVSAAVSAGVDYLGCPELWPPVQTPAGVRSFSREQLKRALPQRPAPRAPARASGALASLTPTP